MHSFLHLCSYSSLLVGIWRIGDLLHAHNPWKSCTSTWHAIRSLHSPTSTLNESIAALEDHDFSSQVAKYSCTKVAHKAASFHTEGCHTLPQVRSLRVLHAYHRLHAEHAPSTRIRFIGNSLAEQYYLAATCFFDEVSASKHIVVDYHFEGENLPKSFLTYIADSHAWPSNVPVDTTLMVLGPGTWHRSNQSNEEYEDFLSLGAPHLAKLIHDKHIKIFWISQLPSDAIADEILTPVGVTFINATALIHQRIERDPSLHASELHWCNPGPHSVPTFINEMVFHLAATSALKEREALLHEVNRSE